MYHPLPSPSTPSRTSPAFVCALREVSTQCEILPSVYTTAEELNTTIIRNAINTNYSMIIQLYRCGDINSIAENIPMFLEGIPMDEMDFILNNRNKQMAAKIAQLLDNEGLAAGTSSTKKMLFAVGLTHWIAGGDDSLESLLKDYGYSLVHIPEWDQDQADDHTNEHCDVILDSDTGLFVHDQDVDDPGPTPSPTLVGILPGNISSPFPTNIASEERSTSPATEMPSPIASAEGASLAPVATSGSAAYCTSRKMMFASVCFIYLTFRSK